MKNLKRLSSLLCVAALLFSLSACNNNKVEESTDTGAADAIIAANTKAEEATSMSAVTVMHMDIEMSEGSQNYNINMDMDMNIDMIMDPMQMQIAFSMDMGEMLGGVIDGEVYITETDGVYTSHTHTLGQWTTDEIDLGDLAQYNVKATMQLYLNSAESFKNEGEETLESGVTATKYSGVIANDALNEVMASTGVTDNMAGIAADDSIDWEALYQDMGDMPVSIWISSDGYPVRYEIDMTQLMDKMFTNMMEQLGGSEANIEIGTNAVTMTMDCTYNTITEISIPEEALAE